MLRDGEMSDYMREEARFWSAYKKRAEIGLQGGLIDLRNMVVARSTKRMPKWRLRLAPDLVMELQPHKPGVNTLPGFSGRALWIEGACIEDLTDSKKAFRERRGRQNLVRVGFDIDCGFDADCASNGIAFSPSEANWRGKRPDDDIMAVRQRIIDAFNQGYFAEIGPNNMLRACCIVCGKGLTDPKSMARWIGPECAGTNSGVTRRLIRPDTMATATAIKCKRQPDGSVTETEMSREEVSILVFEDASGQQHARLRENDQ